MALQVWLPLNGDLHNQGLANIEVVNNGATINNNGKIGKCYQFGTVASDITLSASSMTNFTTEASISFWIKILSWNTSYATFFQAGPASTAWAAYRFGVLRNNTGSNLCFTISNGTSASNANYTTSNLELNTWYHLSFCYKTGHCLIYINGILYHDYATTIVPDFSGITTIKIGRCTNNSSYQTNCLINDFRIYDHVLSAKEVEEIAKGLVLHYKLDDTYFQHNINLMPNYLDMNLGSANASTGTWRLAGSNTMTKSRVQINDSPEGLCYGFQNAGVQTPEDGSCYGIDSFLLEANTIYTISMWARIIEGTEAYAGYNVYSLSEELGGSHLNIQKNYRVTQLPSNGNWIKCWYTFKTNSSSTRNIYIGIVTGNTNVTTQMCCVHIEKVNNTIDNIIYDLSGYNNNGTIINSLQVIAPSPRYNCVTHFSATNQKIKIDNLTTAGFGNSYSFAWWEKINSVGPMHWGFANGTRLNGMYTGRLWNTGDGSKNPLYIPGTTTQVAEPSVNIWHHWVMTGDGTKCKVYQDGELWAEAKTYKGITGTTIYLNGWDETTTYSSNNASMSDFRIYATALTEMQVKELYNTSMIIENDTIKPRDLE